MTGGMTWVLLHPQATPEHLGMIPSFLLTSDPRPAAEQIDDRYRHGGGWTPVPKFRLAPDTGILSYPGDPPLVPIAMTKLREEVIYFYDHSWLAILQPDGSSEVSRLD